MNQLKSAALATLVALATATPSHAGDGPEFWSCRELWQARNQIYKDQGYCFRTPRAIRTFGNAGCTYDNVNDVPMSANQRREVREIERYERSRSCSR